MEKYIERECSKHGLTKYIYVKSSKKYVCVKCRSEAVQRKRYKLKHDLIEYKGGKCEICGYDKCDAALEFHHLNPEEKDFGIAYKGYTRSFKKCKEEVDKCILVCANCHREIHENDPQRQEKKEFVIQHAKPLSKKILLNIDNVLNYLKNGLTQKETAEKVNVSLATLKRFLVENNIKQKDYISSINENKDIFQLMIEYKNFTTVGKILGISDNGVRKRLKKMGYPIKLEEILALNAK